MLLRKSSEIGLENHTEMKNESIKSDSDSVGNSAIKVDPNENSTAEQIQLQVIITVRLRYCFFLSKRFLKLMNAVINSYKKSN